MKSECCSVGLLFSKGFVHELQLKFFYYFTKMLMLMLMLCLCCCCLKHFLKRAKIKKKEANGLRFNYKTIFNLEICH